ncbi:MAG: pyridoxal phosphate-dependent aminotransferase [bacterium]
MRTIIFDNLNKIDIINKMVAKKEKRLEISARARHIPPSPIRKLVPLADRAKAEGMKVYHLNIGQPDIETPRQMIDAMKSFDFTVLAYGRSDGEPALKKEFARYYQRNGIDVLEEQIIVSTAGSEAIIFAISATCSPDEEILVFEPFYTNYNGFASILGVRLKPIRTNIENGFHLPTEDEILTKITDKTRAMMICTPNNPTGTVLTNEEMVILSEIAREHNLFIISDEVYREFCYGDIEHTSILQIENIDDNAILVDSISKRFSACGARIGCVASRNKDVMESIMCMAQARLCPPIVEQIGAISALQLPLENYILGMIDKFKSRRDTIVKELSSIEGISFRKPEGAFYIQAKLPVKDTEHFASWLLTDYKSKDNETVMVAPGNGFYASKGAGLDEIRIAYVLNEDDLVRAVNCLREALQLYKDKF